MSPLGAIVLSDLLEVVWVSLAGGIGISVIFSLVIYASARAAEARRAGSGAVAAAYGGLAILALALFMGSLVVGVTIMLSK
jgi:hypothetical protein